MEGDVNLTAQQPVEAHKSKFQSSAAFVPFFESVRLLIRCRPQGHSDGKFLNERPRESWILLSSLWENVSDKPLRQELKQTFKMRHINLLLDSPTGQYDSSLSFRRSNLTVSRKGTQRPWVGRRKRSKMDMRPAESYMAGA